MPDLDMPVRIALSGKLRSGKDTVADYLVTEHGFTRFAFADRLKSLAVEMFGMKPNSKNRALLITLSQRMLSVDRMVFVNYVLTRIPLKCDVVISDVRYMHEYHALKMLGFKMVRVHVDRDEQIRRVRLTEPDLNLELLDDPSETDLDGIADWDEVLDTSLSRKMVNLILADDVTRWRNNA